MIWVSMVLKVLQDRTYRMNSKTAGERKTTKKHFYILIHYMEKKHTISEYIAARIQIEVKEKQETNEEKLEKAREEYYTK